MRAEEGGGEEGDRGGRASEKWRGKEGGTSEAESELRARRAARDGGTERDKD